MEVASLPDDLMIKIFAEYFPIDHLLDTLALVNTKWSHLALSSLCLGLETIVVGAWENHRQIELIYGESTAKFRKRLSIINDEKNQQNFLKFVVSMLNFCQQNGKSYNFRMSNGDLSASREFLYILRYVRRAKKLNISGDYSIPPDDLHTYDWDFSSLEDLTIREGKFRTIKLTTMNDHYVYWDELLMAQAILGRRRGIPRNLRNFHWNLPHRHVQPVAFQTVMNFLLKSSNFYSLNCLTFDSSQDLRIDLSFLDFIFQKLGAMPGLENLNWSLSLDIPENGAGDVIGRNLVVGFKNLKSLSFWDFEEPRTTVNLTFHFPDQLQYLKLSGVGTFTQINFVPKINRPMINLKKFICSENPQQILELIDSLCKFCPNLNFLQFCGLELLPVNEILSRLRHSYHRCSKNCRRKFLTVVKSSNTFNGFSDDDLIDDSSILNLVIKNCYVRGYMNEDIFADSIRDCFCGVEGQICTKSGTILLQIRKDS